MSDWTENFGRKIDREFGNFCKDIQDQIRDNRFLMEPQKQKFINMLQECADKAESEPGNTTAALRTGLGGLHSDIQTTSGQGLRIV